MSETPKYPCPHSRPDWRMCPHCGGFAFRLPEGTHYDYEETSPGSFLVRILDEEGNEVTLPDPTDDWAFETKVYDAN